MTLRKNTKAEESTPLPVLVAIIVMILLVCVLLFALPNLIRTVFK